MEGEYYGWRGKIGLISPAISDSTILELYKVLPDGVLVTAVDLRVQNLVEAEFDRVITGYQDAARVLAYEGVEVVIAGGTPPLIKAGFETPERMIQAIQKITGKPTTTTPTAQVNALQTAGIKKVLMVTPYKPHLNELIKQYFEFVGFEVVHVKGANIEKNSDLVRHPLSHLYRLVRDAVAEASSSFDGVLIECPRWPVVSLVEVLETDLGVPVVATAEAMALDALRLMNIRDAKMGRGTSTQRFPAQSRFGIP